MNNEASLKDNILIHLKKNSSAVSAQILSNELRASYTQDNGDLLSENISKQLIALEGIGLVYSKDHKDVYGSVNKLYSLTTYGYKYFDPLYKKIWTFFTNDFAKILSIVATILSILALIFG